MGDVRALPGRPTSLWVDTARGDRRAPLDRSLQADVCVVGAGVTGLTTALHLADAGAEVVLLDAHEVGAGVTGHTTAKVTALHELVYAELAGRFGADAAALYARAQQEGVEQVARWVDEHGIACDLRRRPALTYVESAGEAGRIRDEARAAVAAGLPARLVHEADLPFPIAAAVRLDDQLELQPRAYALALADAVEARGGHVFEGTTATGVAHRGDLAVKTATGHEVRARDVVVATLYPFLDRGLLFPRLTPQRSYAIAVRAAGPAPQGMFISADAPKRSIRAHPHPGGELLIVGGEGHLAGEDGRTTGERYRRLARFARDRLGATEVTHRWSAHDLHTADGLPYVGRLSPLSRNVWTACGFRKWGLSNGTTAGRIIADGIRGRESPYARLLDPQRLTPRRSARGIAAEVAKDARHMVGDRLRGADGTLDDVRPGEGRLVKADGRLVAAHRDDSGALHCVSPTCTHLGCTLAWNVAERSWDCPCHGSRFAVGGEVLQGPAVRPLERLDHLARERPGGLTAG